MTYEEWRDSVLRIMKPPKRFDEYEAKMARKKFEDGIDPAEAVCFFQALRDGEDPYEAGDDE